MAQVRIDVDEIEEESIPAVCMVCGEPSRTLVSRNFSWCPGWVAVLILLGLWPYVIVSIILTKYRRMNVPLCERHANHWSWRFWFNLSSFFVFGALVGVIIAAIAYLDNQHRPDTESIFALLILSIPVLFIAWLVSVVIVQNTALRAAEITEHDVSFKKVAPAFAEALEAMRLREEDRMRQRKLRARSDDGIPVVRPLD